ncbi:MAG: molybdate ABC transporter substrate-binding protein, partial [Desulfovibrio sp.]|nr:molybdate ABC transporter substrate-binding protein [Desulfovibrio sp.]
MAEEMVISGAASLTEAFTELKTIFEKQRPSLTAHVNFAASNPLLKQMQEGAPVDVFASADQATMDKAVESKIVDPATRADFARNGLVLIVPKGGK